MRDDLERMNLLMDIYLDTDRPSKICTQPYKPKLPTKGEVKAAVKALNSFRSELLYVLASVGITLNEERRLSREGILTDLPGNYAREHLLNDLIKRIDSAIAEWESMETE
jgi:hypothetical protein